MTEEGSLPISLAMQVAFAQREVDTCRQMMAEDRTGRQEAYRQLLAMKHAIVRSLERLHALQYTAVEDPLL
jgi:hypothetical protein